MTIRAEQFVYRPVTQTDAARQLIMGAHRSVLLLGATGLVGRECLRLLQLDDAFSRIVVISPHPLDPMLLGPKVETHVVNFHRLTSAARFFAVDQIICALGATLKQARTRPRLRKLNLLYPLTAAHLGVENNVSHFLLVSAHGADRSSGLFYNRTKAELEIAVSALPFRSLTIARPKRLLGQKEEAGSGDRVAAALSLLAPARLKRIRASDVALALIRQAVLDEPGRRVLESAELLGCVSGITLRA